MIRRVRDEMSHSLASLSLATSPVLLFEDIMNRSDIHSNVILMLIRSWDLAWICLRWWTVVDSVLFEPKFTETTRSLVNSIFSLKPLVPWLLPLFIWMHTGHTNHWDNEDKELNRYFFVPDLSISNHPALDWLKTLNLIFWNWIFLTKFAIAIYHNSS